MDKAMMARATSSDDSPTPGYMYGEISKMSLSTYDACKELEDYLVARLKKNNHNVKYKCLMIIKHVCRTGRAEFKRDLQRQTEGIRECLQYRGPPDPLRGDQIYKRVQDVAKETLDAIYDSEAPSVSGTSAVSQRIQGFGSEPYNPVALAPPAPASGSLGHITGMANSVVSAVTSKINAAAGGNGGAGASLTAGGGGGIGYGGPSYTGPPGMMVNTGGGGGPYMGPGNSGGSGGGGRYNGMQGMGNPAFQDPRNEKSLLEKTKEMVRTQIGSVVSTVNTAATGIPSGGLQKVTFAAPPDYNYATNRGPTANQWRPGGVPPPTYHGGMAPSSLPPSTEPSTEFPSNASSNSVMSAYHQARNQQAFQWSALGAGGGSSSSTSNGRANANGGSHRNPGGVGGIWVSSPPNGHAGSHSAVVSTPSNQQYTTISSSSSSYPLPSSSSIDSQQQHRAPNYSSNNKDSITVGRVGGGADDGEYERRLVLELCAPGGTRAVPAKEKLEAFLQSTRTLNVDLVGGIILDQLTEEAWQVRSKALAVIEALIRGTSSGGPVPHDFKLFFVDNAGELEALLGDQKAVVRDKAVKILHTLGISINNSSTTPSSPSPGRAGSQRPESPGEASLLDLGDDDETGGRRGESSASMDFLSPAGPSTAATSSTPSRQPIPTATSFDLLGGGDGTPSSSSPASTTLDVFTGPTSSPQIPPQPPAMVQQANPPHQPSSSSSSSNLFSDMTVKKNNSTTTPPSPARPTVPPSYLFADLSLSSPSSSSSISAPPPSPPPSHQHQGNKLSDAELLGLGEPDPLSSSSSQHNPFDPLATGASRRPGSFSTSSGGGNGDLLTLAGPMYMGGLPPRGGPPSMMGGFAPPPGQGHPPGHSPPAHGGYSMMPPVHQHPHHHHQHHPSGGGLVTAGIAPANFNKMGQGMIPPLQRRTIIPSAEEATNAGPSAFAFISSGGGEGCSSASSSGVSSIGSIATHGRIGSSSGNGGKIQPSSGSGEEAFSFVKDAMRKSG